MAWDGADACCKRKEEESTWKKFLAALLALALLLGTAACGSAESTSGESAGEESASEAATASGTEEEPTTLVYGSGDYTRINPAMDEHGEINLLLFNGLTGHDGDNAVVPALAKSWDFDEETCTYTFHLEEDVRWHDGEPFTAEDVQFTIEAIMDPENGSENAPNFEDVEEITVIDDHTISFRLSAPNVAFLDYMTMAILPKHLLEGEDMQTSDFFRTPDRHQARTSSRAGTRGRRITLEKNADYFRGEPNIDTIVFKIVPDDNAKALQLRAGELDLALLTPKDAATFADEEGFACYDMETADYRGILFNFQNEYWQENRDLIPAVCYAIDREAIIDAVLLGQGMAAYGPLQRNIYNYEDVEHYDYDPEKARAVLEAAGCVLGEDGFYTRNGESVVWFVLSVGAGDQVRIDMAQIVAQQLREIGMDVTVDIPAQVDWSGQMAYLIGWGSPFDADDHTYKVFGTDKGANYSGYSNADVDRYLDRGARVGRPGGARRGLRELPEGARRRPGLRVYLLHRRELRGGCVDHGHRRGHRHGPPRRRHLLERRRMDDRLNL